MYDNHNLPIHTPPPIPPFPIQSQAFIQDGLGCSPVQDLELSWVLCECGKWARVMPNTHSESVFWELLIGCPSLQSACPIPHLLTQQSRKDVCALPSFCMWCPMKKYQPHLSSLGRQDSWPADTTEDNIGRSYEWSLQTICKVLSQTLPNVVLLDWISPKFSKEVDVISIFQMKKLWLRKVRGTCWGHGIFCLPVQDSSALTLPSFLSHFTGVKVENSFSLLPSVSCFLCKMGKCKQTFRIR